MGLQGLACSEGVGPAGVGPALECTGVGWRAWGMGGEWIEAGERERDTHEAEI